MFKYKITELNNRVPDGIKITEDEFNILGAEGWQFLQAYSGYAIWCKVDLGELEGDASKLMKSLTTIAEDMVKDLDKDKENIN